jgi:membrane protease YdiL (CAAX protease family)
MSTSGAFVLISLTFLHGFFMTGGINEETGWRGFALPRLQARYPVIVAVVVVWFFWALWHIPYDLGTGTPLESILLNRILHNFVFAVILAWLYNRTNGSLMAPAIFHPAMNAFGDALPRTDASTAILVAVAIVAIMTDRMWEKLPADSRAVTRI